MQKGGEIMHTSSFEHIIRIQFNALMMTVIKCTVKSRNRQFARHSKRETLFCELSDMKIFEQGTEPLSLLPLFVLISAMYSCPLSAPVAVNNQKDN